MYKNHGFTLIELLVVVLIIGILSAVALPQYTKAVEKSRIASIYPIMKSLIAAEDAYFMANGMYTCNFDELDISLNFGEPFTEDKFSGQQNAEWKLGCLANGDWRALRAIRQKGKYRTITVQYSLNASGRLPAGWYCVDVAYEHACERFYSLSESDKVVNGWFGYWYEMPTS